MKKKAVIWGLYRSQKDTKMTQFFGNNFTEDRWRKAALKNAFSLLGKQRFEHSAAFFLLAGHLKDAVEVCLEKLNDIQLALVISRLYESEFEVSSTYKSVLQKRILGSVFSGKESTGNMYSDPFLRSMGYWILEDYSKALDTLIKHSFEDEGDIGDGSASCNPAVFNFYNYLRTHPLLLRRHFGSSDASSTHMCLTVENGLADKINLDERRLFFTTAYAHLKAGCPMLALEVLSKMPKVVRRSKPFCRSPSLMDTSKDFSPSSPLKELEIKDESSSIDWSQPALNDLGSSSDCSSGKHSSSTLSFDWSQPNIVFQDEGLKLQLDSDEGDENEDSSLVMKELKPLKKNEKSYETSSSYTESFSVVDEKDILSPSEDIISAQLKFRACLKILTVELRTLSTGCEVDGGKLRYQLYQWLEREVIALQKTCDYSVEIDEIQCGISMMPEEAALHGNTVDVTDQQKNMLQKGNFQKRHQWLLKYQSLLRMFLSYCVLHGSHGGGLASVRMELILLLQESQQEQSIQTPSSPVLEQSSVPLLFACTASAKTVVANPLLHLGNLTHDILHAIINLDSPPHPDTQDNKIYVMHNLAASLSACIYQCLCDGHSYSSFQANQFTGTVYQTVLLTQRNSLRSTLEETVTPNTPPAQWPGITALVRLLNSAGEEAQPGLTVLLCEILTAVYLSLFIHGLATHSSNELYRIMAHPLNNKMWSAIFGGGAHTPIRGQQQLKTKTGRHFPMPSPHQVVVFSMECVGFSKSLTAFSTHSPTKSAGKIIDLVLGLYMQFAMCDEKIDSNTPEAAAQTEELYSSPDPEKIQSPFTQKYQACRANLQSTSWLTLSSKMVYSQELNLPEGVEIISVKPSAGHLSSSSIYPVCRPPYLLATSCTDGKVRFWRCRVTNESSVSSMPESNVHSDVTYIWEEWPLLIEDGLLSSSAINVPGRPTEVSCAHTNRLAVAYKQVTSKNNHLSQDFVMHVSIFECESTGGSSWVLEQTLHLDEIGTMLDSAVSIDSNLVAYNRQEVSLSCGNVIPSTKHLVHLDWMSREDGSHILTVGIGSKLYMFGQLSGKMQEQNGKETVAISHIGSTTTKATNFSRFVLLRSVDLVSSVEGSPPFPVSLSWVRDGILVVGMDCEMHVYSQWQPPAKQGLVSTDSCSMPSITSLMKESQSAASGLPPPKRTLTRSMTSLAQKLSGKRSAFDLSAEMEDSGLFEAAHMLSPTLPQYHPHQLLELMDLGKVRRTKAILSHLVKCIAGEVVAINESEPNHDRRLRSLIISASGSTSRDPKTFSKTETTDYIEIDSVPPLPLYALLAADDDSSHSCSEKSHSQNSQSKNDMPKDNYEDLFQNSVISTDELVTFDAEEDSVKPKVIDLSQFSPTYFGPEHAQVLSRHLLHSSLPGLTRMEQMSLMALADTIATTSTDIGESRDRSQGGETLDECGLKFLLAVRLHTFLTTSLPPVHRAQLLHQGLSTSHFAWAFHSVAEEELLSMLPAMQKGDPTWSELRAMGIGWWVRNIHSLRKCIEKVKIVP
ncbi:dmX-like protein 1 [Meleagris gallopavo]|uniref:dmX-like protein 1 n=1 Tax=Meleagris gallopavo TaxID=9103 RepID=UPI000549982D|nr:dmX-like protein 1 [Meleagris gallopavo]